MEPSKLPTDVLALGQQLVSEMGLENSVDTLGRWIAHHIAEFIVMSQNAPTAEERLKAERLAKTAIRRLWRRCILQPSNTCPPRPLQELLRLAK